MESGDADAGGQGIPCAELGVPNAVIEAVARNPRALRAPATRGAALAVAHAGPSAASPAPASSASATSLREERELRAPALGRLEASGQQRALLPGAAQGGRCSSTTCSDKESVAGGDAIGYPGAALDRASTPPPRRALTVTPVERVTPKLDGRRGDRRLRAGAGARPPVCSLVLALSPT